MTVIEYLKVQFTAGKMMTQTKQDDNIINAVCSLKSHTTLSPPLPFFPFGTIFNEKSTCGTP
jgi:hypothetical protein